MNLKQWWRLFRYNSNLTPSEEEKLQNLKHEYDIRQATETVDRLRQQVEQGGGAYIYYPPPTEERAPYTKLLAMSILLNAGWPLREVSRYVAEWVQTADMGNQPPKAGNIHLIHLTEEKEWLLEQYAYFSSQSRYEARTALAKEMQGRREAANIE